jgi:hypothetical protein
MWTRWASELGVLADDLTGAAGRSRPPPPSTAPPITPPFLLPPTLDRQPRPSEAPWWHRRRPWQTAFPRRDPPTRARTPDRARVPPARPHPHLPLGPRFGRVANRRRTVPRLSTARIQAQPRGPGQGAKGVVVVGWTCQDPGDDRRASSA